MTRIISVLSIALFLALCFSFANSTSARAAVEIGEGIELYGDARARMEWDERSSFAGIDEERDRQRYRLRVGFVYTPPELPLELGARFVSGSFGDANSQHQTLGNDGDFSKNSLSIDKAFIKAKYKGGWLWFGKNSVPLWMQNGYFWDTDVNPEGVAFGYTLKDLGPVALTVQGGQFVLDDGGWHDTNGATSNGDTDVDLWMAQLVVVTELEPVDVTFAYGIVDTDEGATVRGGGVTTLEATYTLASLQAKVKAIENVGITVGYDYFSGDVPSVTPGSDEDAGSVITLKGSYKKAWAKVALLDIDLHAVSPFAQDDFSSYYSDFEGTALHIGYKFTKKINVELIQYAGERKLDAPAAADPEELERVRLNFNMKF
ncbi:MAG: putative porin [Deltaproteobacteria bacterium]|nr:putative porin [Deltaproteobacteria bacterium]